MMASDKFFEQQYEAAKEAYDRVGVDVEAAMEKLAKVAISIHCWQGDDVTGFEVKEEGLFGGGIQATGNYPGRARNADELRQDADKAMSLIPGKHRFNLHMIYAETEGKVVDRDALEPKHFQNWIDWAKDKGIGLDFNSSFYAHPKAETGFTLSSLDDGIRKFWIDHAKASRDIAEAMGKALGSSTACNLWIPDGFKDIPIDRKTPRELLKDSLDDIFTEKKDPKYMRDAVECKLFGIGSESCVIGSHEFYMGYAVKNDMMLCLDTGHFHPTEVVSDKISSVMLYLDEVLLHVSRGVRWDSDHVVILSDELRALMQELVRGDYLGRTRIGLDFFDASINRVAAWTTGVRASLKAILLALLEPTPMLKEAEAKGDYTARLAMLEEVKALPFGGIWNYYCVKNDVAPDFGWLDSIRDYEKDVQFKRD